MPKNFHILCLLVSHYVHQMLHSHHNLFSSQFVLMCANFVSFEKYLKFSVHELVELSHGILWESESYFFLNVVIHQVWWWCVALLDLLTTVQVVCIQRNCLLAVCPPFVHLQQMHCIVVFNSLAIWIGLEGKYSEVLLPGSDYGHLVAKIVAVLSHTFVLHLKPLEPCTSRNSFS